MFTQKAVIQNNKLSLIMLQTFQEPPDTYNLVPYGFEIHGPSVIKHPYSIFSGCVQYETHDLKQKKEDQIPPNKLLSQWDHSQMTNNTLRRRSNIICFEDLQPSYAITFPPTKSIVAGPQFLHLLVDNENTSSSKSNPILNFIIGKSLEYRYWFPLNIFRRSQIRQLCKK